MKTGLLLIGNELTDGTVQDTNSQYIKERLYTLGVQVTTVLVVRDEKKSILESLDFLSHNNDLIITTGGLGPTRDDLTRESVAEFFNLKLRENPQLLAEIHARFNKAKIDFAEENRKQAMEIQSSVIITNPVGTAPGFIIEKETLLAGFPGVPLELKEMWEFFENYLKQRFPSKHSVQTFWIRTIGIPESTLDKLLHVSDPRVSVGTVAHLGQVDVRFDINSSEQKAQSLFENILDSIPNIKRHLFSQDLKNSFPRSVIEMLKIKGWKVAGAESCTGGWIGKLLTDIAGSSQVYQGGIISYANSSKMKILEVSTNTLKEKGAVSFETALEMRQGIEKLFPDAEICFSVTGIAGPGGGSKQKPVGTVFYSLKTPNINASFHFRFVGNRKQVRTRASMKLLELIWLSSQDLAVNTEYVYGLQDCQILSS